MLYVPIFHRYCRKVSEKGPFLLLKAVWHAFNVDWMTMFFVTSVHVSLYYLPTTSTLKHILSCLWLRFTPFFRMQELILRILMPLCIDALINFIIDQNQDNFSQGIIYTAGLCFLCMMIMIMNHINFYFGSILTLKIKIAFSSLIYQKVKETLHQHFH